MPARQGQASGRASRWLPVLMLAAVFALKLAVLLQLQHHPLLQPDGGLDAASYLALARRVLGGDVALGPGLYYLSPLYIYFLALTLGISDSLTWVRGVQVALGTAAVGFVFMTARDWFGRRAAWIAAGLAALTGVFTFYEIVMLQSSLDAFLTAAALMFLTKALLEAGDRVASAFRRKELVAGLFFGLQILNRPNVLVAVGGVALTLLLIRRPRIAAFLVAGVVLAISPVVLRNAIVARQFALVSSQGGLNFYIGNNPSATGQYVAVPGIRANIDGQSQDTRRVAEKAAGHPLTDAQVSAHFTSLALTWIRDHPGEAVRLFALKLALVFNARHQWLDFSYPYYAHDTGSLLWMLFVGPWLLVPFGLLSLLTLPGGPPLPLRGYGETRDIRARAYVAWASFVAWYAVGVAAFFVAERYRLPMFVPLCVAAGGAVDRVLRLFAPESIPVLRRGRPALLMPLLVLAGGCVLAWWPFHMDDGRFGERLRLAKVYMNRGDYGTAVIELEKAHAIEPANTVAEFNMGMAMVADGRVQDGIAHARHAVNAGVPIAGARYALAGAMLAGDDPSGAAALLRTFYPLGDDDADGCYRVALLALDAGAPDVAERYAIRALTLRPGWPEAQHALDQSRKR